MESDFKMKFNFCHNNLNVTNLEKSLDFYKKALGLKEVKRKEAEDGRSKCIFVGRVYKSSSLYQSLKRPDL